MSAEVGQSHYPTNYFYINRRLLLIGGLLPPKNPTPFVYYAYKFYQIIIYICAVVVCNYSQMIGIFENRHHIRTVMKCCSVSFTVFIASIKVLCWAFRGKHIERVMSTIESEDYHYEKIGDFDPGQLAKDAKQRGFQYGLAFFILGQLVLHMIYIPAYSLSFWYLINDKPIANVTAFQKLPYYSYAPFRRDTPLTYIIALTHECVPFYMYSFNLVGFDSLFMNMMNFIGVHLIILQGAFRTIRPRSLKKIKGPPLTEDGLYNSSELEEIMLLELKKSMKHLQTIIWMCEEIERNCTYVTLGQVFSALYILCTSLLVISMTPLNNEFANEVLYLTAILFQLLLYCWFGNEITLKASGIPQAIWESDWLETRRTYQSCMIMTMMRMKRPLYLTVGKFSPLTLATYTSILKGSYSYYTVLENLHN